MEQKNDVQNPTMLAIKNSEGGKGVKLTDAERRKKRVSIIYTSNEHVSEEEKRRLEQRWQA